MVSFRPFCYILKTESIFNPLVPASPKDMPIDQKNVLGNQILAT